MLAATSNSKRARISRTIGTRNAERAQNGTLRGSPAGVGLLLIQIAQWPDGAEAEPQTPYGKQTPLKGPSVSAVHIRACIIRLSAPPHHFPVGTNRSWSTALSLPRRVPYSLAACVFFLSFAYWHLPLVPRTPVCEINVASE